MSSGPPHSHNPTGCPASYFRLHKLHSRCVALGIQKKSSIAHNGASGDGGMRLAPHVAQHGGPAKSSLVFRVRILFNGKGNIHTRPRR
jgi:hypothetical protein